MTTKPIRVLVVDDHLVVRRGLATLLLAFNDLVLVGEAQNGVEALELCETARPDIVLMDLLMPEMDGVTATRAICEHFPHIRVMVLTSMDEYDLVQRAICAGAGGILLKNMGAEELAVRIRTAVTGHLRQSTLSFEVVMRTALMEQPRWPDPCTDLTEREQGVLNLLVHGLTNPQIASQLIISRATVKYHVSSILSKLGASSRTEAVALAVQAQLATGPGE